MRSGGTGKLLPKSEWMKLIILWIMKIIVRWFVKAYFTEKALFMLS